MQESLTDVQPFRYKVIRSKRRTMALEIRQDGQVVVRAPYRISQVRIQRFVEEKADWIQKNLEKIQNQQQEKTQLPKLSQEERIRLQKAAGEVFLQRSRYFAELLNVHFNRITIREQKTRWGSCSSNRNLNFNWKLMLAPPEILDYVVVHELCHLKEMNHSPAFWHEVEQILPDYAQRKKWLKDNGWKLMQA
ncbi:M48 family metallopeptidase [Ruminococcus sp. 5_1_39BFAA]|uniref:M48 family metallopeptidase n=1 Tax=Ruminococcus sp. 5_1_39BFAA TaxID=457412 RepID=UPI003567BB14